MDRETVSQSDSQTDKQTDITLLVQVSSKGGRADLDMQGVQVVSTHVSAACQDAGKHPAWRQYPLGGPNPNGYALVPRRLITQAQHQHKVQI